jgi:hypothetical protein
LSKVVFLLPLGERVGVRGEKGISPFLKGTSANLTAGDCFYSSFRRKPESRVPGENRDPVFDMAPDFRRHHHWMPDQIRHDGIGTFIKRV